MVINYDNTTTLNNIVNKDWITDRITWLNNLCFRSRSDSDDSSDTDDSRSRSSSRRDQYRSRSPRRREDRPESHKKRYSDSSPSSDSDYSEDDRFKQREKKKMQNIQLSKEERR